MEMAEGRFTRTTRRLMTVLQLNDRERPVAMDNIRLVAITVRRLFITLYQVWRVSRALQSSHDDGGDFGTHIYLQIINPHLLL